MWLLDLGAKTLGLARWDKIIGRLYGADLDSHSYLRSTKNFDRNECSYLFGLLSLNKWWSFSLSGWKL